MDTQSRRFGSASLTRQALPWTILPILVLTLIVPPVVKAQVATDISSSGLNTTATHVEGTTTYNITGGTRPGDGLNLFHSFGNFNVGPGDTANFFNDSGLDTSNIIGRVTGGESLIYGTIQTTDFGNANLFLLNPSGIVLGPSASLNVGGSVSFTTAQYLRLFDGAVSANFYTNPANDGLATSILTIEPGAFTFLNASPTAYGFLTAPDPNATITVQGSNLSVLSGQSISLIGGKVVIEGGAQVTAPSGKILLATAASPGEFDVNTLQSFPNVDGTSFTSSGTVSMTSGSSIDVHDASTVWIRGGQLALSVNDATLNTTESNAPINTISLSLGSSMVTANAGAGPGADMQLIASSIQFDGASIQSITTGDGHGGNISITDAQSVNLTNGAQIVSSTHGGGNGGEIAIATTNTSDSSVTISGYDSTFTLNGLAPLGLVASGAYSTASSSGSGGQISLTAATVQLDSFGTLATLNSGSSTLDQNGQLVSQFGGDLAINATTVRVEGGFVLSVTGIDLTTGATGSGHGGNVTVQGLPGIANGIADSVMLNNSAFILAQTVGVGRGGDVHITANKLTMEGASIIAATDGGNGLGGDTSLNVWTLDLLGSSQILSYTKNVGPDLNGSGVDVPDGTGGSVTIQGISHEPGSAASDIVLSGGSQITSLTEGGGRSGQISISATSLDLNEGSTLLSSTAGTGDGGNIELNVGEVSLSGQSTITSRTSFNGSNAGKGGTIRIQGLDGSSPQADALRLTDPGSGIFSTAFGPGSLGDIEVHAKIVRMMNEAAILIGSEGDIAKTGGKVTIEADSVSISGGSAIGSQVSTADAGQVIITANQLTLDGGSIITSTSGPGRAGDVMLHVGNISLSNGSKINSASTATAGLVHGDGTTEVPGRAGDITISATGSFTGNASTISTSAEANHGGDISITAHNVQLSNGTLVNANSNGPITVTKLVLDTNNQLVKQVVGDGNAGNIRITSGSTFLMQNSLVTTEASQASGGQITINAPDMIRLIDSTVSTSVAGAANDSNGGNISIDPDFVILKGSQILAQAVQGEGGDINIVAGLFLADPSSLVDATSEKGISGTVQINAPINNLSSVVGRLPESLIEVQALLRAACAARMAQGGASSFVERGRDSIPAGPEGLLASPYLPVTSRPPATFGGEPVIGADGIQLRRLPGNEFPALNTILSGNTACSS